MLSSVASISDISREGHVKNCCTVQNLNYKTQNSDQKTVLNLARLQTSTFYLIFKKSPSYPHLPSFHNDPAG